METPEAKHEENTTGGTEIKFSSVIREFCDNTTAHGLGRIHFVNHWIRKVFWSVLFIGAVTMLCIQVHTLFDKYRKRPLTTLVTVKTETSLEFPAVTFCNFNAMKNFTTQSGDEKLTEIVHQLQAQNSSKVPGNDTSEAVSEGSNTEDIEWSQEDFQDPEDLDTRYQRGKEMSVFLAKEDLQILTLLGHQFSDMVLSCTFRGMSCRNYTTWNWTSFWHYKYGNCFVFNGDQVNGVPVDILRSNNRGPSEGLNLEINIDQEEYIGQLTPQAGIRVDISKPGEMPFPLEKGVSLAPGYATMLGLRKIIKERKDPFNTKRCLNSVDRDDNNLYTRIFNVTYSSTACRESCLAYNQFEICGCVEYRFPAEGLFNICSVTNIKTLKCLSRVQNLYKNNRLNCTQSCPPPCRLEEFKISSSFATWPSQNYEKYYQEIVLENYNRLLITKSGSHRKNVLKLQVFFEDLDVEVVSEQRSYELVNFVSDIGGQLGLWIGFSVLTLAEFLELIMLMCHLAVKKCFKKNGTSESYLPN